MTSLLLSSAVFMTMGVSLALADDAYMASAKDYIAKVTAPAPPWTGPTTGPAAVGHKLIVYISTDGRNGGVKGVSDGAEEAAKVIGWTYRTLDGQGSVSGRATALSQAIALKPDGIILGSVDAAEQAPLIQQAVQSGIKIVAWHSGPKPGKIHNSPVFTNITTNPLDVAKAAALLAVVDSGGKANVVLFTDSIYSIATAKTNAEAAVLKGCQGCSILAIEDTPLGDVSNRMPQLTTSLLSKYGVKWTYSIGVNDLYYDFISPSLQSAGIDGDGYPRNISAGDGSKSAFERIRDKQYQIGTVADPLRLQGWQAIDELNRAFAGQPPSGFVNPVHLFTSSNIDSDGGKNGIFDPDNGYRDAYKKIWGK
ncbi:substrate-binding domain-containing protein [Acidisoma cellulosilytica]|uniref:Substrate-binding domain-containing protein n=1 Tax=Acidisoma cellulosilyticum TaxID=2802395 RepID=A0A964E1T5_9PROT|nr:substrate-binding domain-containing protein [Acidisoma cellulosilyticum]